MNDGICGNFFAFLLQIISIFQFYLFNNEFLLIFFILDCCDGSDEYFNFGGKCGNNCLEQGKEEIQALKNEVKKHREGAAARREYIIRAQNLKPKLLNDIKVLEEKITLKKAEHEEIKAKEESAKAINNEAKDILDDKSEDYIREDEETDDEDKRERREDENILQKREEFFAKHQITPDEAHKRFYLYLY